MERTRIAFYIEFIKGYLNTIEHQLELLDRMVMDDAFDSLSKRNSQRMVLEIQETSEKAYKDSLELWLELSKEDKNG